MSRAALQRSMRNAAKAGALPVRGDPFSIIEPWLPEEAHISAALPM